jgi:antitoxin (DNA-binding transcriptional repressor) of toxin-antitoxin stability system
MTREKTVGIKELKNNLSAYLREVRTGARVLVSDRGEIVAELHEPQAAYSTGRPEDAALAEMARKGWIRLPTEPRQPMGRSPHRLPAGT